MEFFEDAINKAKGAIDVAYKKTNEAVSIQKQKFDIASMESKLSKSFEELGKVALDFINAGTEPTEEAKSLAEEIVAKQKEIDAAKNDVLKAQGKKFCRNCGIANVANAHFCYACGADLIETENEQ